MISLIIPSSRPKSLAHAIEQVKLQSISFPFEIIIIQEGDKDFGCIEYPFNCHIIKQSQHFDNGANARDVGIRNANYPYVAFWDDDNIYYQHALSTLVAVSYGFDIGIVQTRHLHLKIPVKFPAEAGDIDTMCFAIRTEIAQKVKWEDKNGRYNDYRYIMKILKLTRHFNFVPIVIGRHL